MMDLESESTDLNDIDSNTQNDLLLSNIDQKPTKKFFGVSKFCTLSQISTPCHASKGLGQILEYKMDPIEDDLFKYTNLVFQEHMRDT